MKLIVSPETKYELHRFTRRWGPLAVQYLVALSFLSFGILFYISTAGRAAEIVVLRWFYEFRGDRPSNDAVIVVPIDDESFKELHASTKFPLPRKYIAEALEKIVAAEPDVIIIDARFPDEAVIDPESDLRIERALRTGPTTIWNGLMPSDSRNPEDNFQIAPGEQFRKAAKLELPMTLRIDNGNVIYMGTRTAWSELENHIPLHRALHELGSRKPYDADPMDLINYYGPPKAISHISLYKFVGNSDPDLLQAIKGKVVLIGHEAKFFARGTSAKDDFSVPHTYRSMFGVEIHATIVSNLLDGTFLKRRKFNHELLLLVGAIFVMALSAVRFPNVLTLSLITLGVLACTIYGYISFAYFNRWVAGIGTIGVMYCVICVGAAFYLYRRSRKYQRYIEATFNFERDRNM